MESVKSALNCIGVPAEGQISVCFHLFGFRRARVPTDPDGSTTSEVSLRRQLTALEGKHIHLNVIRVGIDNFTSQEIDRIDYAIYRARNIYRDISLGVGRVLHYDVTSSDADGRDDLGSMDEAEDLTHEWSVPNSGLDVFVVDEISDSTWIGLSPVGGPCDKDDKDMNGVIGGEVNRGDEGFSRTFAHEIGHYLGCPHNHGDGECPVSTAGQNNLMAQTRCAISTRSSVSLTSSQGSTMRGHCSVRDGC